MRDLLNNSEERRLKLIEFLYFFSNSAKKEDVLEFLVCKENTLRSDIDFLNEKYSKILKVKLSSNEMKLEFLDNQSISTFYEDILDNLIIFKLIESIFFSKHSSIDDLSSNLYTSPSTVYRLIGKFNESALKNYKISIDTRTLHFQGEERDIRNFYIQYFSEKYTYQKWPFEKIDKKCLQNLFLEFVKLYNLRIPYSDFEVMGIICAVNISRYLDGFTLEESDVNELTKKFYKTYFVDNTPPANVKNALDQLGLDTSFKSLYNVFHNYIHKDFIYNFEYYLNQPMESKECSVMRKSINYLFGAIYSLTNKLGVPIANADELTVILNNLSLSYNSYPRSNYILYNINEFYVNKMRVNYKNAVEAVYQEMEKYVLAMKGYIDKNEVNFLTYYLLSNWVGLIPSMLKTKSKVKILTASITNFYHSINMKDYLEIMLSDFIEVEIYKGQVFDLDKIDIDKYDFIFTDFTLSVEEPAKWKYFHGNHSYKDIMSISDLIYKKFFEKNNEL